VNTIVVYHRADFDGMFSGLVCAKFLPEAKLIGWDFGDQLITVDPLDTVYVVDLPLTCLTAWTPENTIWIDHHKSSIEAQTLEGLPNRRYLIDGVAACRLCWAWFMAEHNDPVYGRLAELRDFVNRQVDEPLSLTLAGEYDVWDKHDARADAFQFGLTANGANMDSNVYELVRLLMWDNDVCKKLTTEYTMEVVHAGHAAMRWQSAFAEQVCRERHYVREWEGRTFCVLASCHTRNSMWFPSKAIPQECDALMCWRYDGKTVSFSLYHAPGKEHIDLSPIAVKYGGGGHRGACGFAMPLDEALTVIR